MQITADLQELEALGRAVQDATGQLGGLVVDLRRRIAVGPLTNLTRYGIDPTAWLSEFEQVADALTVDALALEQSALQVERVLVQTAQAESGGDMSSLAAAMPDLWWFHTVTPALPVVATTPAAQAIVDVANKLGVDPILALADATKESGTPGNVASIDPNAVGDNGSSFGVYQLHWGGELNDLGTTFDAARARALDATTNAETALSRFAAVAKAHPEYTPGQVAAAAQRPADPVGYAADVDRAYQMIKAAGLAQVTATATPVDTAGGDMSTNIVAAAEAWIGTPYVWGGGHTGGVVAPGAEGVDCSGLVRMVFGENGLTLNGTAADLMTRGTVVADLASAKPGDLLFWGSGSNIHHVAIYIGNGKMIEAPHTGATVHETDVYFGDFAGIRRVLA